MQTPDSPRSQLPKTEVKSRRQGMRDSTAAIFQRHWLLYVFEAAELAAFMISACAFTVLLFADTGWAVTHIPSAALRRLCMGIAMGITAILIIQSPMGKRSGAHFNPGITLTYLRLGKIARLDACFYIVFQFVGGVAGVAISALLLGSRLAAPGVNYAVTIPGAWGSMGAFAAEWLMAFLLMTIVLGLSNRPSIARYTSYAVGILISQYILFLAPVSGFSINPARTVGSAFFAHVWKGLWIYFAAPTAGMLLAAELHLRARGADNILCAKLHPDTTYPCPFSCHYPGHKGD